MIFKIAEYEYEYEYQAHEYEYEYEYEKMYSSTDSSTTSLAQIVPLHTHGRRQGGAEGANAPSSRLAPPPPKEKKGGRGVAVWNVAACGDFFLNEVGIVYMERPNSNLSYVFTTSIYTIMWRSFSLIHVFFAIPMTH